MGLLKNVDQSRSRYSWLICVLMLLALLFIVSVIVLALIPVYLPRAHANFSTQKFRKEDATIIFVLPNQIIGNKITIRQGYLSVEQKKILEQWLNNKLKTSTNRHPSRILIVDAMINTPLSRVVDIGARTKRQDQTNNSLVRLIKKNSDWSDDTRSELNVDFIAEFTMDCSRRCRTNTLRYVLDELFLFMDIDSQSYLAMFATTTTSSTTTINITATTSTSLSTISPNPLADHIIASLNHISVFPSGSYAALVSSFGQASDNFNLLPLNNTLLQQIASIDNSSFIFESGRQQLYFRLPPGSYQQSHRFKNISHIISRQDNPNEITGLALRFDQTEDSNSITILPLYGPDISYVYTMPDGSHVIRLQLRSPTSMCSLNSDPSPTVCMPMNVIGRSVLNNNQLSSPLSTGVNIACGYVCALSSSLCSASCSTKCDGQQVSGSDTPVTRRYDMGSKSLEFRFDFQTYSIEDRITVWNDATLLFDTGCVGQLDTTTIKYSGTSPFIRVDVEPNCACGSFLGCTGTLWYFTVHCSKCDPSEIAILKSGTTSVNNGDTLWIDENSVMPPLKGTSCLPDSVRWSVRFKYRASFTGATAFASPVITGASTENNPFDITAALGNKVYGGDGSAKWSVSASSTTSAQSGEIKFKILGRQPSKSAIMTYIESKRAPWYAKPIALIESYGGSQFAIDGSGYPLSATDNGYGIYQLTSPSPTYEQLFGWKHNVDEGIQRLLSKQSVAKTWMTRQRIQAGSVTVPDERVGNCYFTNSNITDAVAIKAFNGASMGHYCAWDNATKAWKFNRVNNKGRNYVLKVCNQPI